MLKFLRWFMKLLKPEPSGFVHNMQTDPSQGKEYAKDQVTGKKAIREKDLVYWIPTNKIVEIKKNSQGITTNIHLASGSAFLPIEYDGKLETRQKKQGLSRVSHHIEISPAKSEALKLQLEEILSKGTKISILHINRYGDGFLYGEVKGLAVEILDNNNIVLKGTEDNVFYELTRECMQKAVPKTE